MASDDLSRHHLSEYESYVTSEREIATIMSSLSHRITPTCITNVWNVDMWRQYHNRKQEYLRRLGDVEEVLLWHATAKCNVESILRNNFEWSRAERSRYGFGVCFSTDAEYANLYCNKKNGHRRALIATIVLVGKICVGRPTMRVPQPTCDTSIGRRGLVYVKFGCNEFYPAFVVYYNNDDENIPTDVNLDSMNISRVRCHTDEFFGFRTYQSSGPDYINFTNDCFTNQGLNHTSFAIDNTRFHQQTLNNLYCNNINYHANNWMQNVGYGNINNSFFTGMPTCQPPLRYDIYRQHNNNVSHYNNRRPFEMHGTIVNINLNRKRKRVSLDSNEGYYYGKKKQKRDLCNNSSKY